MNTFFFFWNSKRKITPCSKFGPLKYIRNFFYYWQIHWKLLTAVSSCIHQIPIQNIKELCGLILMENNCMGTREEFREKSVNLRNIPLSCWTSPLSIFSSFFNFDNSASSLVIACFAFSTSFFLIMAPSWYAAIFFFSLSMASLEASQQVFGQFTLPSYSSVPSQQSPHCKQKKYRKKKKTRLRYAFLLNLS